MNAKNKKKRFRFMERRKPTRRKVSGRQPAMIQLKSPEQVGKLREAGRLVAECFALLQDSIAPGVRLDDLDAEVERLIRERGALPLYKGYRGNPPDHPPFPGVICASVNQEICHGIPDARALAEGDIVGIDIGLRHEGWCGDACVTFPVGQISERAQRLLKVSEECLYLGIEQARAGNRLYEIGKAIQQHAEDHDYGVVTAWGGHGVGRDLHEPPSIPHTHDREADLILREGMVFTIEPMINEGSPDCAMLEDGWTVVTTDGLLSSQFEHTVAITAEGPQILSEL